MHKDFIIEQVSNKTDIDIEQLAALMINVVSNGASIGFMDNLNEAEATLFWSKVLDKVIQGKVLLFVARETHSGQIVGTVQLQIDLPPNQPHRGDVAKMLVHANYRRQGIAEQLLHYLENIALQHNRYVLVLDTVTDSPAQQLYTKCGWVVVGNIPEYALFPDGKACSTTYMYRKLR